VAASRSSATSLARPQTGDGREVLQLHLFKGKRQRGVRADTKSLAPKEYGLHVALADTLKRWGSPDWFVTHLPFGEHRTPRTAGRLKRMGVRAGPLDFMCLYRHGPQTVWLELKRRGGTLSDPQIAFCAFVAGRGDAVVVVERYEDAVRALQDFGVLPRTIRPQ